MTFAQDHGKKMITFESGMTTAHHLDDVCTPLCRCLTAGGFSAGCG
ncbi:hypothetical protein [Streptomyces sp. NPDC053560]